MLNSLSSSCFSLDEAQRQSKRLKFETRHLPFFRMTYQDFWNPLQSATCRVPWREHPRPCCPLAGMRHNVLWIVVLGYQPDSNFRKEPCYRWNNERCHDNTATWAWCETFQGATYFQWMERQAFCCFGKWPWASTSSSNAKSDKLAVAVEFSCRLNSSNLFLASSS